MGQETTALLMMEEDQIRSLEAMVDQETKIDEEHDCQFSELKIKPQNGISGD